MADSQGNSTDSRRSLYERYKAAVGRSDAGEYFDEDDLIDIYDYANDVNDDFIKLEALFDGAGRYPGSVPLRERRRYFYYYLGNDEAVRTLLERGGTTTVLGRLLALRLKSDRRETTVAELEEILGTLDHKLDDEEVIQFVNEASTNENYEWLLANIDRIRGLVDYVPAFLYEVAAVAMEKPDHATAVKMAEELTMSEPFNVEFWELLAEASFNAMDYDAALNAVDYSLAINPESVKSLKIKAWALFRKNEDSPEALEILSALSGNDDFDSLSMQTLALQLVRAGRPAEALAASERYIRRNPADRPVMDYIFVLDPDSVARRLDNPGFEPDTDNEERFWTDWAVGHALAGRHKVAAALLAHARKRAALTDNAPFLYEEFYRAGMYQELLDIFAGDRDSLRSGHPVVTLAVAMALVRLGRRDAARDMLEAILRGDSADKPFSSVQGAFPRMSAVIYHGGAIRILRELAGALSMSGADCDVDAIDPFNL